MFTSVGARSFVVTKLDIEQKHLWGGTYGAAELRDKLPPMVRTAATGAAGLKTRCNYDDVRGRDDFSVTRQDPRGIQRG
jgi:hypothetical protein